MRWIHCAWMGAAALSLTVQAQAQSLPAGAPPGGQQSPANPPESGTIPGRVNQGQQPAARQAPGQQPAAPDRRVPPPQAGRAGQQGGNPDVLPGPIDSPQDIFETARMIFMLTDTNNDGQISQKEAVDAGNLLVGGFFFRADQNGDGTLTKDEAQQARDALFQQQPMLRFLLTRAERSNTPQGAPGGDAGKELQPSEVARQLGGLLDANNDRQIQATELRQAVQTAVQAMFAIADSDRNGNLSPAELNQSVVTVARESVGGVFKLADADNNGSLTKDEFAKALVQPGYTVFDILDRNLDGQLTTEELDQALRIAMQQVRSMSVTPPANSPQRAIEDVGTTRRQ